MLLDRERVESFTVKPPPGGQGSSTRSMQHLKVRVPVTAGPHELGVTFPEEAVVAARDRSASRTRRTSTCTGIRGSRRRSTRSRSSVRTTPKGPGDTPSRRRIFVCQPAEAGGRRSLRRTQSSPTLMRRAYRRPVDRRGPARSRWSSTARREREGRLRRGIEMALSAVLVSPEFLFRVEQDPAGVAPDTAYRISDLELASRLSFFLWSSIPDDELLDVAERGELQQAGGARAAGAPHAGRPALAKRW